MDYPLQLLLTLFIVSSAPSEIGLTAQSPPIFSHLSVPTDEGTACELFIFPDNAESPVGLKYFAVRASSEYQKWRQDKEILLVTTGAFSSDWSDQANPIGLCVDEGRVLNRIPRKEMDALIIEKGEADSRLTILDLDHERTIIDWGGESLSINPRDGSLVNRVKFLHFAEKNEWTVFQSQLLSSPHSKQKDINIDYGNVAERRMLALASKDEKRYQIIVDLPAPQKLHRAAQIVDQQLSKAGFKLNYLVNLDTGDRNLLYVNLNGKLQKMTAEESSFARLDEATNLLVFYRR